MPSNKAFKKRNPLIYTISQSSSDIKDNRDIDVLERSRKLHLILGVWNCIYCSAKSWQILQIIFYDRNSFSIRVKVGPLKTSLEGTYILQKDRIFFSLINQLFDAEYEISDKILTVENEIVSVMYVKDDF